MSLSSKIQHRIVSLLIFAFPLFFLPTTQEYFLTNKLYLIIFGSCFLVILSAFRLLQTNTISIRWGSVNTYIVSFILIVGASILFSSPNKVQAILQVNMGLGLLVSLLILYMYTSTLKVKPLSILFYSAFTLSIISIVFYFNPLASTTLPTSLQFFKSQFFTPIGSQLDLALFLGYFTVTSLGALSIMMGKKGEKINIFSLIVALTITIGCLISVSLVYKQLTTSSNETGTFRIELPPLNNSYRSAIETLKNPRTAVFGFGVDNFTTAFTQSKPASYNVTSQWDRNFRYSRSALLHIFTEAGLLAMIVFLLICIKALLSLRRFKSTPMGDDWKIVTIGLVYTIFALILTPISLSLLFLLFVSLSHVALFEGTSAIRSQTLPSNKIINIVGTIIICILVVFCFYTTARAYASELAFKQAINYLSAKDGQNVYIYHRKAITYNPYIERYRINFSQLNLLIANNIAKNNNKLDPKQRETIAKAIQIAIQEAKATISLNPQRSTNWENLGAIYRNIINIAQNANVWTISAYQRAIALDPNNPLLRMSLGGVYYSLGRYENATTLFTQAVALKPNFANFRYNLAWAYFQNKKYDRAVVEMQNTLSLLTDKNGADYKKAAQELETFKKLLKNPTTPNAEDLKKNNETQSPLTLPSSPEASLSPKIDLPEGAQTTR